MASPSYYPAFLNLKNKRCIVIGGGEVAERKTISLLKSGANVTVISPMVTKRLKEKSLSGKIKYIPRKYKKGDLKDAFLVVAATDSGETNKRISEDAPHLINIADMPSLCNFIIPSVVRRGHLLIAVSTSGASPSMAKNIRKELERLYVPVFAKYLTSLKKMRLQAMSEIKDKKERERFLKKMATEVREKLRSA